MNPFRTREQAEAYLARIADPAAREATRRKLGLEEDSSSFSAPRADMGIPVSAPAPVPGKSHRPQTVPHTRGGQPLAPDTHTFLGTLEGGALLFALPWGPSVNHYWRHLLVPCKPTKPGAPPYRVQVTISREGRTYRKAVLQALNAYRTHAPFTMPPGARLAVQLTLCGPNRRKFDVDNYAKACLDALTHNEVWVDDSLIDELRVIRGEVCPGGRVVVQITPITGTLFEVQP